MQTEGAKTFPLCKNRPLSSSPKKKMLSSPFSGENERKRHELWLFIYFVLQCLLHRRQHLLLSFVPFTTARANVQQMMLKKSVLKNLLGCLQLTALIVKNCVRPTPPRTISTFFEWVVNELCSSLKNVKSPDGLMLHDEFLTTYNSRVCLMIDFSYRTTN